MPGLTGPSDYSQEPPRHPALLVNSKEPFNAEPHRSCLVSSYVTPVDFFYKRNHGPVPLLDHHNIDKSHISPILEYQHACVILLIFLFFFWNRYSVSIAGLLENRKELHMKDIVKLPKYAVTATLQCAGNRRTAMSKTRKVKGVGWDISALGNAVWSGAKLADVLELVGISKHSHISPHGGKHVEFVSIDKCKEENGGPYKASIPLSHATNPEADVLLAYEMNGETLNRDHGYPLRVIVPGVIGARSVKWLDSINIIAQECQGFFMQKDYKMFPPSVDWDNIDWSTRRPVMDFPIQSAICSLDEVNDLRPGKILIKGYAVSGGGRGIERVDVSIDNGKIWAEASKSQKDGITYISDDNERNDKWAWVLFEAEAAVTDTTTHIVAKAVDIAGNIQPENVEFIWNLRGILNTSWHRVRVHIGGSNLSSAKYSV
ncbi:hypothetical protein ABFX02_11G132600 [Erythranthe guttata]